DQWEQEIQNALHLSWAGLLVISRDALQSLQCKGEHQFFLRKYQRKEKDLFIALIEPFSMDELPYSLSVVQFIDLSVDFKSGLHKLLNAIKAKAPILPPQLQDTHHGKSPGSRIPSPIMPPIFISHSYNVADEEIVYQLQGTLQTAGFQVEFYGDEPGSVRWRMEVAEAIDRAKCVIVIISPEAKTSEWLQHELFYAEARHKGVFGVHVRGEMATLFGFNLVLQVNIQSGYDAALRRLIAALERYVRGR
ncbi:MAG: toll/interleukin-1 receptor domain-containing protein, partial [Anaerolineae bacterium]|nr:toll/interleukin-1 receptor domain-containing protein [Anaerolineae bacterium]